MKDILGEIVEYKKEEVLRQEAALPLAELKARLADAPQSKSMKKALAGSATGIIAEFKRKSPSAGWIFQDADPTVIAPGYERAGASALSVLTDSNFFGGSLDDLVGVRAVVNIPILRKDFIINDYQLYQARVAGADAVLLIAAILSPEQTLDLAAQAHELGMEVLLEVHSEEELGHVHDCIDMVGVNNRNLGSFHTDVANSFRMAESLPEGTLKVSESGISSPETLVSLRSAGYRGFLMGTAFMKTPDPVKALETLMGGYRS